MSNFEDRLKKAIRRGERFQEAQAQKESARRLNEEELRRLHTQFRLTLSEHIESCLGKLPDHFPGFRFETIVGDRGWGAAVSRDDIEIGPGRRRVSYFSRFEIVVRPLSEYHVLDLAAKGTIRNKELINRSFFKDLAEVDVDEYLGLVDAWTVEYAELYSARRGQ